VAENLKAALVEAAQKLEKRDVVGALAALKPLLDKKTDPAFRVEALKVAALAKLLDGEPESARKFMDDAVVTSKRLGPAANARALERRALVRQDAGDLDGAAADLELAATALAAAGQGAARAQIEDRAGILAAARGDFPRAVSCHLVAASLRRGSPADTPRPDAQGAAKSIATGESKDPQGEGLALVQAAGAAHLGGELALARAALERAVTLVESTPEGKAGPLRAQALHNLGVVLSDLDEHDLAIARLDAALEADIASGSPKDAIATRLRLALAARRKGDHARARQQATRARAEADGLKDVVLAVEASLELAAGCLAAGDGAAALVAAQESIELSKDQPRLLARANLTAGSCAKALGKKDAARKGFERARELAESSGDPVLAAAAARELEGLA
jgi:tetratricopeptide (TPR) repeat protein